MGKALSAVALFTGLAVPSIAFAGEIHVPGDFRSLQRAVDAALPGDTVVVDKGRHRGPIIVDTSGITIEGRGGTIVAPPSSVHHGLVAGIEVYGHDVVLRGLSLVRGGARAAADGITVEGCTFARCGEKRQNPAAVEIWGDRAVVRDNHVLGGRGTLLGIFVQGADSVVEGNGVEGNRNNFGVRIVGARARVAGNRISGVDATDGIAVQGVEAVVVDNEVDMPLGQRFGIFVNGDAALLDGNTVDGSVSAGPSIFVAGSDGVVTDNDVTASRGSGIVLRGDANRLARNRIRGVVPGVFGRSTFGHGIVVRGRANEVLDNVVTGTPSDGIRVVGGEETILDGCAVTDSWACGILNASGETTVAGSTFLGNGTDVVNAGSFTSFDGNEFGTGSTEGTSFDGELGEADDFGSGFGYYD